MVQPFFHASPQTRAAHRPDHLGNLVWQEPCESRGALQQRNGRLPLSKADSILKPQVLTNGPCLSSIVFSRLILVEECFADA
jgi:hypothetical protein